MIRTPLDDATRTELQAMRRQALPPAVRDRLEMALLSAAGWSPPRIAAHLGRYPQTVRNALHRFRQRGVAALYPGKAGPPPDAARRGRVTGLLRELLAQDRTWTSAQLAEALRPHGIALGGRQVRRYLGLLRAGYRRTASTLAHKQNPAKVARAKAVLGGVKKKPERAG
jgi:transposase